MSQSELAAKAGMSRTALSRIENGVHHPRLTTRCLLAHALRVSPQELFPEEAPD